MKINPDDPKLTAYALDELPEPERSEFAAAVATSPEAQAFVAETQEIARMLRGEFKQELREAIRKPRNIMPLPEERSAWPETRWSSLALAAVLAVGALLAAVVISGRYDWSGAQQAKRAEPPPLQMEFDLAPPTAAEPALADDPREENPFVQVASSPVSSFPLRVGTGSYGEVQRAIERGVRPPRGAVRIEEMVNYFTYEYPPAENGETFSISIDAASCAWTEGHRLVRVRIKGRDTSAESVIARDAAIEVRFDPVRTVSYRLIGYEGRGGAASGGGDDSAEAIPSGYATTALYEVVPVSAEATVVEASLRYRLPDGATPPALVRTFAGDAVDFHAAPDDFRFAAAVAQFGMMLRASPHSGTATYASVVEWARGANRANDSGRRAGFVHLVERAQALAF